MVGGYRIQGNPQPELPAPSHSSWLLLRNKVVTSDILSRMFFADARKIGISRLSPLSSFPFLCLQKVQKKCFPYKINFQYVFFPLPCSKKKATVLFKNLQSKAKGLKGHPPTPRQCHLFSRLGVYRTFLLSPGHPRGRSKGMMGTGLREKHLWALTCPVGEAGVQQERVRAGRKGCSVQASA